MHGSLRLVVFLAQITLNKVVERFQPSFLEQRAKLHVASDAEVAVVLPLYSSDVRVVALIAKLPVLVSGARAAHARIVCTHSFITSHV